ncbi:hypothetical protein [Homoserinibacter gongjuensis]|uniref:Uncharacterized protein n=1 Tax=Homoserinibacter gongjuensis TaxID=1162968 RepID=A0ABQ6JX10_9MICO|nr:hypothetical protein [Homoserinibacter gongjuensis]GMA91923.1 hypothetical protein GCM10025869_24520 [Homoserinibacter gongjuensis]
MTEEKQPEPAAKYFARFGTFILTGPRTANPETLYTRIGEAIKADNRVVNVALPKLNKHWISTDVYFPGSVDDPEVLLQGSDAMRGIQYPRPFVFELSVPIKNQPKIYGRSASSDHYYVAWDGCIAVILWDAAGAEKPSGAAGQILIEVLETAAESLDLDLYVQACSPGCELKFAHRAMLVETIQGEGPRPRSRSTRPTS